MNNAAYMLFVVGITFLLTSGCNKEKLIDSATSLIGEWTNYDNNGFGEQLIINSEGEGFIVGLDRGVEKSRTKERIWYIKDNELHFGKAAFNGQSYDIERYPKSAYFTIKMGIDSIVAGDTYMVLGERHFRKAE